MDLGLVAVNIASVFVQTNDKVLNHLKEQSEWLSQQKTQYAPISGDFVTKFGWEVFPTPLLGGMSSMVVLHPFIASFSCHVLSLTSSRLFLTGPPSAGSVMQSQSR